MKNTMSGDISQHKKYNIGENFILSPSQCKGARAMLGWSRNKLASEAEVAVGTVVDFERGARQPYKRTLTDLRRALEEAGVVFIDQNGGGPGVRLKEPLAE